MSTKKIKDAFSSVQQKGYGVVMPQLSDIRMEEPVLIAHGNKFGVKMKAISPSIHMIRANIETEIAPIVGSREQAEDLIDYIKMVKTVTVESGRLIFLESLSVSLWRTE